MKGSKKHHRENALLELEVQTAEDSEENSSEKSNDTKHTRGKKLSVTALHHLH